MIRRIDSIYCLMVFVFILGCSNEQKQEQGAGKTVRVEFLNQSQFTVESLFLHDQSLNYLGQPNLLKEPLAPGKSIEDLIPARPWYVTVYRRPNQDSDLLAYTTATAWDSSRYDTIIYFDEQFRVSESP